MNTQRYYTAEEVRAEFDQLPKESKIEILFEALSVMQQYNGRSRLLCIAMAMGYENSEGGRDTYELPQTE